MKRITNLFFHSIISSLLLMVFCDVASGSMVLPFHQYLPRDGLSSRDVWSVLEDPSHGIWVSTSSGLDLISARGIRSFGPEDGLDNPAALAFTLDSHGRLWVATESGIFIRSDSTFLRQPALDGLSGRVTALESGAGDELLIAAGSRLYRLHANTLEPLEFSADSLLFEFHENDLVRGISAMGDSILWLVREISGLWFIDRNTQTARCIRWHGKHIRTSQQICISKTGKIIGEVDEQLLNIDAESGRVRAIENATIEDCLLGVTEENAGLYWMADRRSLWRMDSNGTSVRYRLDLPDYVMRQLLMDREGSIG